MENSKDKEMKKFKLSNNGVAPKLGNYMIPKNIDFKVAVDLGSNMGLFTKKYHNKFEKIYFFEASYENYIKSLANILSSGIKNSVGFNLAASKKSGELLKIYSHSNGDCGSNSIVETDRINHNDYHMVPSISFKDIFSLISEEKINYLKIDIEGAEYDLLMKADLSNVECIAIEIHNLLGEDKMQEIRDKISLTHTRLSVKKAIPNIRNEEATYVIRDTR